MKENPKGGSAARDVERRNGRYLVGAAPPELLPTGMGMVDPSAVFEQLSALPDVTLHRTLRTSASATLATLGAGGTQPSTIAVFEMPEERAAALSQSPEILCEPDRRLSVVTAPMPTLAPPHIPPDPGTVVALGRETKVSFRIQGRDGGGLAGATVLVQGRNWPVQGVTGSDGRVSVTLTADTASTIQNVYVRPAAGYWERSIDRPRLSADEDNLIILDPLSRLLPEFPERQSFGWGQRAMRFDRIPPTYRGDGIKIAIIDSGVDVKHPDLEGQVRAGLDLVSRNEKGWSTDEVGHGSHCAGIIAGGDTRHGVIGIAPGAEVHACKIFPGGRFSDLIEALDYCIAQQIDVVNLSLGADNGSTFVAQKIEEARRAGVACIVAAGNSAGAVKFPASLPTVFTVAAMGKIDTFPADSNHAKQIVGRPNQDGYFAARFSCFGPEVDAVAPGVAIVSSVPSSQYAAWDGTSMAAPHVTGLAALILAHRADFQRQFTSGGERVQQLFDVLQSSSQPLPEFGPGRSGAGLPDASRALGLTYGPVPVPVMAVGAVDLTEVEALLATLRTSMERAGLAAASAAYAGHGLGSLYQGL